MIIDQFDRLPPQAIDAEKCCISSILLDQELIEPISEILSPDAFYLEEHRLMFSIAVEMRRAGKTIDTLIFREELIRRGKLDDIGGTGYLAEMMEAVPTAANGLYYASIVIDRYRRRQIISAANEAIRDAYDGEDSERAAESLSRAAEAIRDTGGIDHTITIGDAVSASLDSIKGGKMRRLLTGFCEGDMSFNSPDSQQSLDYITGGFPFGGMTIIGARPRVGKSQLSKQLALSWARNGTPVGIVSIEEDRLKIGDNTLSNQSGIENWKIQHNRLTNDDITWLEDEVERIKRLPIFINDCVMKLTDIENAIRRLVRKRGCSVIIVDHLHLIELDDESSRFRGNETSIVTKISKRLKFLFKRLGVVGVVACQLNRSNQETEDSTPMLNNLRESGAIEQDGDLILLLHRRDIYRKNPHEMDKKLEVHVAKNKSGACGMIPLYFDGDHQAVLDWNGRYTHQSSNSKPEVLPWEH